MIALEPSPANRSALSLRLGFVPLTDCAPIAVAQEMGLFEKYELHVILSREPGWATIRDKIAYRELDAAQSPLALVFAMNLGEQCLATKACIPLVLTAQGNAITLSHSIPPTAIRDGSRLKSSTKVSWSTDRKPTFAAVHPWSSHSVLMHSWLAQQGFTPGKDVDILYLPPSVMARNLAAGVIDGFCVGEPWNSVAIQDGSGWCAAVSAEMVPRHTEKVLATNEAFTLLYPDRVVSLTAALLEACAFCQDPANHDALVEILARPKYLGMDAQAISNSLATKFNSGFGEMPIPHFHIFSDPDINRPTTDKANWITTGLRSTGVMKNKRLPTLSSIFREDLFDQALAALKTS